MKKISGPNEKDGVYEITPADAAEILQRMKKNRPLRDADARAIAKDIQESKWTCNGETLIFNGDDSLLDGQHRLRACVLANQPIRSYVVWGFGSTVAEFDSLDQGRVRGAGDRLALDGVRNYSLQASIARIAIRYDAMVALDSKSIVAKDRISVAAIRIKRARLSPQIDTTAEFVKSYMKQFRSLCGLAGVGFVHVSNSKNESTKAKADSFVHSLATGEGLSGSNAVLALRNNLISRATSQQHTPPDVNLALLIRGWNAYAKGRPVKIIKWDTEREAFPRFD